MTSVTAIDGGLRFVRELRGDREDREFCSVSEQSIDDIPREILMWEKFDLCLFSSLSDLILLLLNNMITNNVCDFNI